MVKAKFWQSWLAYVVVTFVFAFTWHMVVFKDLYRELAIYTRGDDPIIPLGIVSMLMQGAVLAYLYPRFARGSGPVIDGLKFGLLMGLFLASGTVFAEAAKQNVTSLPTWLIVESVYYEIQFGIVGIVIGLIYGKRPQN